MKLKILAAVVAGTFALPMVAQAGLAETMSIDGDIGVFYIDSTESINELGTELNFDGAAEVDGVTYMGHLEVDVNGGSVVTADDLNNGGSSVNIDQSVRIDEVRVGAKGAFGEFWLGDVGNACDQFDPGSSDIWLGGASQSCRGSAVNNVLYKSSFGAAKFAVSHNPNQDESSIAAQFGMGPVSVNLGYEDGVGSDDDLVSFGVAGSFNGVSLNAEGNDDDAWGVNASYTMNAHTAWIGYGDEDTGSGSSEDRLALGYRMSHGKMDYIIEHRDFGPSNDETIVGMRYRF